MFRIHSVTQFLTTASALLVLSACGQTQSASNMTVRATGIRSASGQGPSASAVLLTGRITNTSSMQDAFQAAVGGLMSDEMPASYLGFVSAQAQSNTGILFGGKVNLAEGSLSTYSGTGTVLVASSLRIQITDSFPGSPSLAPLPVIYMQNAVGSLVGNSASIRFYDSDGYIELDGQFDVSQFTGQVTYWNAHNYDGTTPGSTGVLGQFAISTCSIFVCN